MGTSILAALPRSWFLGYSIAIVVTLVVVALLVPIILLALSIGKEAKMIDDALQEAVRNTAPLSELRTTIDSVVVIVNGLNRGRKKLGG